MPRRSENLGFTDLPGWVSDPAVRSELQRAMTRGAGVLRSAGSLTATAEELTRLAGLRATPHNAAWESTNLLTVATVLVAAARTRRETRGCHWREDHPVAEDEWRGHLLHTLDAQLQQTFEEMA